MHERYARLWSDARVRVGMLTLTCFLLASTGWLMWLRRLSELVPAAYADVLTMGLGYLMQAAGLAMFAYLVRTRGARVLRRGVVTSLVAYVICLVPAVASHDLAAVLAFGNAANLACGFYQGMYLWALASMMEDRFRGRVFGAAYAASTVLGWTLSVAGGGVMASFPVGLLTCVVLAAAAVWQMRSLPVLPFVGAEGRSDEATRDTGRAHVGASVAGRVPAQDDKEQATRLVPLACVTVVLLSLTKNMGFSFPTADVIAGLSLEQSRLLYGAGLLLAGFASDRDRRLGALCCASATVLPFLMLSLAGAGAPALLLWGMDYLLYGFFSVYRVLLLVDLSAERRAPGLAVAGLAFGRVGDAAGTLLCVGLEGSPLALVIVAAVMFAGTVALFFVLYQQMYGQAAEPELTERERFELFAQQHDLSAREREVLRLVLDERSTAEMASELFLSAATIKFHIRNLLKKTGCKNRVELVSRYILENS